MASGDVTPRILSGAAPLDYGVQLGTTDTTIVFADDISLNTKTVKQIIICNTGGAERLVTIGINGTAANNAICYNLPIAANDTITIDTALTLEPYVMGPTTYGFLVGKSDSADQVTVTAMGWETEA